MIEISSNFNNQDQARRRVRHIRRVGHIPQTPVAKGAGLDVGRFCLWETGKISLRPKQVTAIEESLLKVIAGRLRAIEEVVAVST